MKFRAVCGLFAAPGVPRANKVTMDHMCSNLSWELPRVPCFHVLSRCTSKLSSANHQQQDQEHHHHHHHHQHHHHHHHHECRSASCEVVSLHRLLTLLMFVASWVSVGAAPRRTAGNDIARYNPDNVQTNSLISTQNLSQSVATSSLESSLMALSIKSSATKHHQVDSTLTGSETAMNIPLLDSLRLSGKFPASMSQRVTFSAERPQTPPWPADFTLDGDINVEGDKANKTHSRRKRSVSNLESVCDSVSGWKTKTWGTDMYGQNVTILSNIMSSGNREMTQWFYETACARPHGVLSQSCRGIDNGIYDSLCLTKKSWVYAVIRTSRGEEGWSWIAISTSCNCAIRQLTSLERIRRVVGIR